MPFRSFLTLSYFAFLCNGVCLGRGLLLAGSKLISLFTMSRSYIIYIIFSTAYAITERCTLDSACLIPESECGIDVSCNCSTECLKTNASTCQSGISNYTTQKNFRIAYYTYIIFVLAILNSCSYFGCDGNCMKLSQHYQLACGSTSTHFLDEMTGILENHKSPSYK